MRTHLIGNDDYEVANLANVQEHNVSEGIVFRSSPGYHTVVTSPKLIDAELMAHLIVEARRRSERAITELSETLLSSQVFRSVIQQLLPSQAMVKPNTALFSAESARLALQKALPDTLSASARQFMIELITVALVSANLMMPPPAQYYPTRRTRLIPNLLDIQTESYYQELMLIFGSVKATVDFGAMSSISATELATQLVGQLQRIGRELMAVGRTQRHIEAAFALLRILITGSDPELVEVHALRSHPAAQKLLSNFTLMSLLLNDEAPAPLAIQSFEYAPALQTLVDLLVNSKRMSVVPLTDFSKLFGHYQIKGQKERILGSVVYRNIGVPAGLQAVSLLERSRETSLFEVTPLADASKTLEQYVTGPLSTLKLERTAAYVASIVAQAGGDLLAGGRCFVLGLDQDDEASAIYHYAAARSPAVVTYSDEGFTTLGFRQDVQHQNYATLSPELAGSLFTVDPFEAITVSPENVPAEVVNPTGQLLPLDKGPHLYIMGERMVSMTFASSLSEPWVGQLTLGDNVIHLPEQQTTRMLALVNRPDLRLVIPRLAQRVVAAHLDAATSLIQLLTDETVGVRSDVVQNLRHQVAMMLNAMLFPLYSKSTTTMLVKAAKTGILVRLTPAERGAMATSLEHSTAMVQLRALMTIMLMKAAGVIQGQEQEVQLRQLFEDTRFSLVMASLALEN